MDFVHFKQRFNTTLEYYLQDRELLFPRKSVYCYGRNKCHMGIKIVKSNALVSSYLRGNFVSKSLELVNFQLILKISYQKPNEGSAVKETQFFALSALKPIYVRKLLKFLGTTSFR